MPFLKKMELRDLSEKYGQSQRGIVALEPIRDGEPVFVCDMSICNYYPLNDPRNKLTKAEVLRLIEENPQATNYIQYYSYMVDDDVFTVPRHYKTLETTESCVYFNHSCDPNCGFSDGSEYSIVAIRDIQPGEEMTYHYGLMETENSLTIGMVCKCGAKDCPGKLKFDFWRDPQWQEKYAKYSAGYIQRKIGQLKEEQKAEKK